MDQILRCFLDLVSTEFDFNAAPTAVRKFDNGVDLVASIILIMIEHRIEGFRVDLQITLALGFKEEAEGLQIANQPLRRHF